MGWLLPCRHQIVGICRTCDVLDAHKDTRKMVGRLGADYQNALHTTSHALAAEAQATRDGMARLVGEQLRSDEQTRQMLAAQAEQARRDRQDERERAEHAQRQDVLDQLEADRRRQGRWDVLFAPELDAAWASAAETARATGQPWGEREQSAWLADWAVRAHNMQLDLTSQVRDRETQRQWELRNADRITQQAEQLLVAQELDERRARAAALEEQVAFERLQGEDRGLAAARLNVTHDRKVAAQFRAAGVVLTVVVAMYGLLSTTAWVVALPIALLWAVRASKLPALPQDDGSDSPVGEGDPRPRGVRAVVTWTLAQVPRAGAVAAALTTVGVGERTLREAFYAAVTAAVLTAVAYRPILLERPFGHDRGDWKQVEVLRRKYGWTRDIYEKNQERLRARAELAATEKRMPKKSPLKHALITQVRRDEDVRRERIAQELAARMEQSLDRVAAQRWERAVGLFADVFGEDLTRQARLRQVGAWEDLPWYERFGTSQDLESALSRFEADTLLPDEIKTARQDGPQPAMEIVDDHGQSLLVMAQCGRVLRLLVPCQSCGRVAMSTTPIRALPDLAVAADQVDDVACC